MLANFFGKSNPANLIIIFLVFLGYFSAAFFLGYTEQESLIWFASLMGGFFILFFFFNFILAKNKLTLYNSYGFLFFVLMFGMFPASFFDRRELFINIVLLIMLRRIYSLRTPKDVVKKMFDSGFWLAILFILDPFSAIFGLLIFSSIAFFQKLNLKSALIPMVGFMVPLICYFAYTFYWSDISVFTNLFSWYTDYDFSIYKDPKMFIPILFIGILIIFSVIFKTPKVLLVSGNYRKFWSLIIINLLVSVAFIVLAKEKNGAELMCAFFPVAVILTNGIEGFSKRIFQDIILMIFVLIPIILFII